MKRLFILAVNLLFCAMVALPVLGQQAPPTRSNAELLQIADRLYGDNRLDEARLIYLKLLATAPKDFHLNLNLGNCFANGRRPELNRAIEFFQTALSAAATEAQSDEMVSALARTYQRANRVASGLALLRERAEQHPQHPEHWRE